MSFLKISYFSRGIYFCSGLFWVVFIEILMQLPLCLLMYNFWNVLLRFLFSPIDLCFPFPQPKISWACFRKLFQNIIVVASFSYLFAIVCIWKMWKLTQDIFDLLVQFISKFLFWKNRFAVRRKCWLFSCKRRNIQKYYW